MKKRKVCFVITSKIHYGRSKTVLEELRDRENIELQIVLGGSALLPQYGDVISLMKKEGFDHDVKVVMNLEGGDLVAMAKTAGIGVMEFTTAFDNLAPDIVIVRADRFEVLSAAIAAAYLNIPIAHIEGGDVSGTIDESIRHAITKLAHIHFATTEEAKNRILRMGERSEYVYNFGCSELEYISKHNYKISNDRINYLGVGAKIDINKKFIIVMQHPVTTEFGQNKKNIEETLKAINELGIPAIWFWPNIDAGTDEISKGIRTFRENNDPQNIRFIKYLPPEEFIALLKKTTCLVGNSSAGIKECSFLGTPVVNIGTRQNNRKRAENVMDAGYNKEEIKQAVAKQLKHGNYEVSPIYYQDETSKKMVDVLSGVELYTQKKFMDNF